MKTKLSLFLLLPFCCLIFSLQAQIFSGPLNLEDTTQLHLVVMKNGDAYIGHINHIMDTKVDMTIQGKSKTFDLTEIARISAKNAEKVKYRLPAYNASQLFISPTAMIIDQGLSEYRTVYGILHTWDSSSSENMQFGLGATFPLFLMVRGKFSWNAGRKAKMAIGLNYSFVPLSIGNEWLASSHYFMALTTGSRNNLFNLGLNLFKFSESLADLEDNPDGYVFSLTVGGRIRIHDHWQILAENTLSTVTENLDFALLPSFGAAWFNEKNTVEFGFKRSTFFNEALLPLIGNQSLAQLPFLAYSRRIYK